MATSGSTLDLRQSAVKSLTAMMKMAGERNAIQRQTPKRAINPGPPHVPPRLFRRVWDAENRRGLPGDRLLIEEGGALPDSREGWEAYEHTGTTFRFFSEVFGRNSVDDDGMTLTSSVHYGRANDNASWNGGQMVFGDGDGHVFAPFTRSLDVVAHEMTHAVVQYTCGLEYSGQSGALNEHFADVFGSLVKQWHLRQKADEADWLIGKELINPMADPPINARGLRSLMAPGTAYDDEEMGKDPQPAHMQAYNPTTADSGGVHINSGIPNHAFYLAATAVGGFAWEKLGLVWYKTLDRLSPAATFSQCAAATISSARAFVPGDDNLEAAITQAWLKVGVITNEELSAWKLTS